MRGDRLEPGAGLGRDASPAGHPTDQADRMAEKGQVLSGCKRAPSESEAERWPEGLREGARGAGRQDPVSLGRSRRELGSGSASRTCWPEELGSGCGGLQEGTCVSVWDKMWADRPGLLTEGESLHGQLDSSAFRGAVRVVDLETK